MDICELFEGFEYQGELLKREVLGVSDDTRKLRREEIFFAREGSEENGELYARKALELGAICVVSKRALGCERNIVVEDFDSVFEGVVNRFYNNPLEGMTVIGITGTNGKTTTAHIVWDILNFAGIKCGVIGTLGAKWLDCKIDLDNTTPSYLEFCKIISKMREDSVTHVVCEVSAHAIEQKRLRGVKFDIGVFTNISQDHLDYFSSMENYTAVKLSFLTNQSCRCRVVNADTEHGRILVDADRERTLTYGIENPADVFGIDFEEDGERQSFVLNVFDEVYFVESGLLGEFNSYNLLAGITVCRMLGVKGKQLVEGIKKIRPVDGRYRVYKGDKTVIIDYAHTPDGMENLLKAIRKRCDGIVCVFGCGGDRDKTKRPLMGAVAEQYASTVIITEDNSRWENEEEIFNEIKSGMTKNPVIIPDRREAIKRAIDLAKNDEIVVILGKGAEKYIEKRGKREYYSDEDEVKKHLALT